MIFQPKILTTLRDEYTRSNFYNDLVAGVIVGIVALPLAIAFAIASGVKPEQGLYTAIIAGFIISLLGGSRVQISGPTGAFVVVVYSIVQQHGYEGLAIATFIAGFLLIGMGLLRMGNFLRFIPYPLTIGFTSGIAVIIFSGQIKDLLGLSTPALPADFIGKWVLIVENISSLNLHAVALSFISLLLLIVWPKITHKIPGSLVVLILATLCTSIFELPLETIGSRFGEIPRSLPTPTFPRLNWEVFTNLFSAAVTIALLGSIESLLSAVVADGMLGTRHRSDTELIAQGVGNILSPLFLGIPATGAIARTATNVKSGGRTPVAGIIHALTLLLIMLFLAPLASSIPMAALAAVLVHVSYKMGEWHTFAKILKWPRSDSLVMIVTFALTVLVDLTVAIQVGVVLAGFLFLKRMEQSTEVGLITNQLASHLNEEQEQLSSEALSAPEGVEVFEIFGPLFYAAVDRFNATITRIEKPPKVLILRMRNVPAIDGSAVRALEDLLLFCQKNSTLLILSGLKNQPLETLKKAEFIAKIGRENICPNITEALNRAKD
ncbi:MAG: sulfate permease [Deltaproteobacteria bacterium]|nr:sulfate permease [Deltaproteobacteria bacterium]